MTETRIKGRRRGDIAPFSQLQTTGEIDKFKTGEFYTAYTREHYKEGRMCPYAPYIPLAYVTTQYNIRQMPWIDDSSGPAYIKAVIGKPGTAEEWEKIYKDKFTKHPMRDFVWEGYCKWGGDPFMGAKAYIKEHIEYNKFVDMQDLRNYTFYRKDDVKSSFTGSTWKPNRFNFKTYSGYVSPYSIWIKGERNYNPHIIAVIRAEDWAYQRFYMLLHKTIDMSKVIVLVDNRVDGTFPFNAFKGFYKEQLEPELKKLSCPVFKVPHGYIMENCFIQPYHIQEKNIFKRKQAIEQLVDEFYNKYGEKSEKIPLISTNGVAIDNNFPGLIVTVASTQNVSFTVEPAF